MSSKSPRNRNAAPAPDPKRRRNIITATVIALAVVGAAVLIIAGSGGDSKSKTASGGSLSGTAESKQLLDGIPQQGNTLGDPKAPVTLFEYIDYQCPFCRQYVTGPGLTVINKYVRPGKVKVITMLLTFIGPDSEKAARAATAAGVQNKQANFTDLLYRNQGQENSGYMTDAYLDQLFTAAGVDKVKANALRRSEASRTEITAGQKGAEKYGVVSTPTFVMGKSGGPYQKVDVAIDSADGITAALDALLKG